MSVPGVPQELRVPNSPRVRVRPAAKEHSARRGCEMRVPGLPQTLPVPDTPGVRARPGQPWSEGACEVAATVASPAAAAAAAAAEYE